MTAAECPVCATPFEAGATTCAFCGVSLLEPESKPAAKPKAKARSAARAPALDASTAEASPPAPSTSIVEPTMDAVSPGPAEVVDIAALPADAPASPAAGEDDGIAAMQAEDATTPSTTDNAEPGEAQADPPPAPADGAHAQAPSFAKDRAAASATQRRVHRREWGIVGALALLLAVQVVASDFGPLAASGATRPWLGSACAVLRCTLPPWREPRALHLLQRDVRADPQHPGLLRVSASFRNDARWAQPWPLLRVTLSDADGRAIAARDFDAKEYLGGGATTNGIASGQVASVAFDVADPSPRVTAFTFEFR